MSLEKAQEIFDQARKLEDNLEFNKAIELLRKIEKEDSCTVYPKAQFQIGLMFQKQKNYQDAVEAYKKVLKDDNPNIYAIAQFNLGLIFEELGNYEKAKATYKNVLKNDNLKYYAKAQINLGILFDKQGNYEQAEVAYQKVLKDDNPEYYAGAQFNLGVLYDRQKKYKLVEDIYTKIINDEEYGVKAKINLANLYRSQKKYSESELILNEFIEENTEPYARAQLLLGLVFKEQSKYKQAVDAFKRVPHGVSSNLYASAQFSIGHLFQQQENYVEAEKAYKRVLSEDNPREYAKASWNLAIILKDDKYFERIEKEHDENLYYESCFILGEKSEDRCYQNSKWEKISEFSEVYLNNSYLISNTLKIFKLIENNNQYTILNILKNINQILERLFVELKSEELIAHYTNINVSKLLISHDHKDLKVKSLLRLNTINLMNDPVEGKLLHSFLNMDSSSIKVDKSEQAFIACFTLHHDSLNQFRLYGKYENEEASGLSLVLNKKFFSDRHNAANIYKQLINTESSQPLIDSIKLNEDSNNKEDVKVTELKFSKSQKSKLLPLMPLYRCIYLDPTSGFIKVAQREEWSFCREDEKPSSERWEIYHGEIGVIEDDVKKLLAELSELIKKIPKIQLETKTGELLNEILLPLQYLVKHMAFKEEQECRMVYVTQMDSDLIQFDETINRVYIDYEPSVMKHLEKIYLAPKAKDEQTVFEYLCAQGQKLGINQKGVKVKISQNPFR